MPGTPGHDDRGSVRPAFVLSVAELEARVEDLKRDGVDPVERSALTAAQRTAALTARSDAFSHATQGKGKPMGYGHGSRERYLKETGQKA